MALKDWKKYSHGYFDKIGMKSIGIYQLAKNNKWIVTIETSGCFAASKQLGIFKTKPQALKYAIAYMRNH